MPVVADDDLRHPQFAVFELDINTGCIGIEAVPDKFGDGQDRLRLRLSLKEVGLDFKRVAVLSHCLRTFHGSSPGSSSVQG